MSTYVKDLSDQDFESQVIQNDGVVLLDFWAPWCGPCQAIGPFIERIAKEFQGEVAVYKVNIDEQKQSAAQLGVRSIPAFFVFRNGEIFHELHGAPDPQKLVATLESALG